jgi:carboxylesterase
MSIHATHPNDFAWMRKGQHLNFCSDEDALLLKPYEKEHRPKKQRALLMLHGFSSSPAAFRLIYPHLEHYDYVYAPLLAGHGVSLKEFANSSREQWLQKTRLVCKKLCQEYGRVDIMGLSLGGLLACHLVHEFPFHRMILLAPALALYSSLPLLLKTATISKKLGFQFIKNAGGRSYQPHADELLFRLLPISSVIEILKFIDEYSFQKWDTPTEVFLGRYDDVVDSKAVENTLKLLDDVKIHYLEQSNHVLPLDANYQEIISVL